MSKFNERNLRPSPSRVRFDMSAQQSSSDQMQGLLNEFRGLYEGRLRKLDEAEKTGEKTEKVRVF